MRENGVYPPKKTSLKHLICQLAWASENGIKLANVVKDVEIMLYHPKSDWDFRIRLDSARDRLDAEKVIVNWVNQIYPATFDKCYWP